MSDSMVAQAEKSLGLGEPNYIQAWYRQKQGSAYSGNFAWCDASISYWAWHSGNQGAVTYGGYFAYTVAHASAFKKHNQWHRDVAGIQRGDIVFFDWGLTDDIFGIDHVGLVTGRDGSNVFTIEGNTANVCARRVRHADTIAGYGRPAYVASAPRPVPAPPAAHPVYEPYPGKSFFVPGRKSSIVARCRARLIANHCNMYNTASNKDVWGTGDVASYAAYQHKLGYTGADANGIPGKVSWDKLKVPRA